MKALAKKILETLTLALPWGGREAVLAALCKEEGQYKMLMKLAADVHVVAFSVRGQYGTLQGSAKDGSILRSYAETGLWAQRTVNLIKNYIDPMGGQYVDVGANIGATTIPIAQNPKVSCLALEPEPTNHQHLTFNILANCHHGNVVVKRMAAFSRRGTMSFEVSPSNMGDNRLRLTDQAGALGEERWEAISVETAPLDEIVPKSEQPLVVKIDTQGAEPFVVEGGHQTLARSNLLIMEFSPYMMKRMDADQRPLLEFLRANFDHMSIATGENDPIPAPLPINQACEVLAALATDPRVYVDVITGKDVKRAVGPR